MRSLSNLLRSLITVALLVFLVTGRAGAEQQDIALTPQWREALQPLRRMPVQDTGFVRTAFTFAENYISAISGKKTIGNADSFEAVIYLLRNPQAAETVQLIKLTQPELIKLYGSQRISVAQWRDEQYRPTLMELIRADQEKWMKVLNSIEYRTGLLEGVEEEFAIVPRSGEWLTPSEALKAGNLDATDMKILDGWKQLRESLAADDAAAGGTAARALADDVEAAANKCTSNMPNLGLDLFYHKHQPFRNAAFFYLFSALFYGAALVLAKPKLNWAGYALLALGLAENIVGITARWILSGRAPLSNMYESFTFAVGGMVLVALILEGMRVTRLVGLGGAVLGFIFMVLAHKAPIFDSQIRPLMPALQSSWLTYHVVTIMLSYSAFALSFFVSIVYLGKDFLLGGDAATGLGSKLPGLKALDVFNYRIIGVGFPLLSLGHHLRRRLGRHRLGPSRGASTRRKPGRPSRGSSTRSTCTCATWRAGAGDAPRSSRSWDSSPCFSPTLA
jgi:ABC-type uncharacterized transport system permease subunit